jgi:microcystin-dependent protein
MSDPFIGEIKIVAFNYPPRGWAFCDGQLLPIAQNQALFAIIGTTYGGNGVTTFALPNLQGRIPLHAGNGVALGETGGEAGHVLTINEMPSHTHQARAVTSPTTPVASPAGALWASGSTSMFAATPDTAMSAAAVTNAGLNQPHENQAPYLVLNFAVALQGIFPSRN